jgi:hypothetical protein
VGARGSVVTPPGSGDISEQSVHRVTQRCCYLFEEFAMMLRDKEPRSAKQARSRLERWTQRAKVSESTELKAFAVKLSQYTEVVATMILPYSQGQTGNG